jgi:hypothetical protein
LSRERADLEHRGGMCKVGNWFFDHRLSEDPE